ncbi:MAG: S-layer homology domain-containing protein, partial [Oscillibacter sp.]|nr:S-layer homology domain-containing protein [Oscillibacter sp.]
PSHGSLSASARTVRAGTTVTITATPGTDYVLDEVTVRGKSSKRNIATSPTSDDNKRTFEMPSEGVTVSATFAQLYAVELARVDFGYVTVSSERNKQGASVTITAHPEDGYKAEDIRVYANNERLPLTSQGDNTATFRMPANNVYVSATFSRVYDVTLANPDLAFGYVTVSSEHNTAGASVTITAHPEEGYKAENIRAYVGNEPIPVTSVDANTATFVMPANNVYVSATFVRNGFVDMDESNWFYADAMWAVERGLMTGVRDNTWAPYDNISTATAVVTLARLQMGDQADAILKEFENDMFDRPWLPRGPAEGESTTTSNWYYREARWAAASGILTENVFTGRDPLSRANFAIILRNYLRYRGITVEVPEPFDFSDADAIRARGEELNEDLNGAFQILRTADVFRGDRTESMLPNNNSTRAHMAALLHRLTNYIAEYERRWTQGESEESGA